MEQLPKLSDWQRTGRSPMIAALAGGVGGAKLAEGLYRALPPDSLTVIVNTADDFDHFGLRVCPDADTVMYTLAGIANPTTGWGIEGDTFEALAMLGRYGHDTWFRIGDRDFATHITRTLRLRDGDPLSAIIASLARALGVRATILPMCDEPVATLVDTPDGRLEFQEYFVRRHHADEVRGIVLQGAAEARVSESVGDALRKADAILLCPSNPIVSVGPILAVPGLRPLLVSADTPKVAVSPIVGGRALKGPADRMLASLGHEVSAYGVAALYRDFLTGIVIDVADANLVDRIEALGVRVLVAETVMEDVTDRRRLAEQVLAFAEQLGAMVGR